MDMVIAGLVALLVALVLDNVRLRRKIATIHAMMEAEIARLNKSTQALSQAQSVSQRQPH